MDKFSVDSRLRTLKTAEKAALRRGDYEAAKRVKKYSTRKTDTFNNSEEIFLSIKHLVARAEK